MQSYGPMFRIARDDLIKAQNQWSKKQTKTETFSNPTTSHHSPRPTSTLSGSLSPDDVPLPSLPSSPRTLDTPQPFQDIDVELKSALEEADK
ncbi:hypothetical protein E2C01_096588 [Portunus trituberculatus]|uniref:Uncharacterized protein n=1 Tax=Portunus trituberculatus TaxID=210409 RepID=A0A5B7K2E8_PORTR|nr:hypothetical protein [Portunus trituberculatus]